MEHSSEVGEKQLVAHLQVVALGQVLGYQNVAGLLQQGGQIGRDGALFSRDPDAAEQRIFVRIDTDAIIDEIELTWICRAKARV